LTILQTRMIRILTNYRERKQVSFDWYEEVPRTKRITQGDIFFHFPVPIIRETNEYPYFEGGYNHKNVIIMSQACDIEQDKINEITFCPIVPVEKIAVEMLLADQVSGRQNQLKTAEGNEKLTKELLTKPITIDFSKEGIINKIRKKVDELRKGNYFVFYLLNETPLSTFSFEMGPHVVLLKETFQIPKSSVIKLGSDPKKSPPTRLRLMPPYREHLAQAFANVYNRIGLPEDIKPNEVRLNLPKEAKDFPFHPRKI
jgi:hypothetical protein